MNKGKSPETTPAAMWNYRTAKWTLKEPKKKKCKNFYRTGCPGKWWGHHPWRCSKNM